MKFPKHLLKIGMGHTQTEQDGGSQAAIIDLGDDFSFEEDMGTIFQTLSFKMPRIKIKNFSTLNVQKYDLLQLYFKKFDTESQANNADIETMTLIFDGYVDRIEVSESKSSGTSFQLYVNTTMGLADERTLTIKSFNSNLSTLFQHADGYDENGGSVNYGVDLKSFVPLNKREFDDFGDNFFIRISPDNFFTKVLESVKEKYAINIFQTCNGILYVKRPLYFSDTVETFEYDLEENVFEIDYGDLTQKYDSVVVLGTNAFGFAFDPIAYQLKYEGKNDNLNPNVDIDINKLNPFIIYRRDISMPEECQSVAKNKLVEFAQNNTITLVVDFIPEQRVGQGFRVHNSDVINSEQIWIIKKRSVTINKGVLTCSITGYSNGIIDFPEDMLTPSTGLLDIDVLSIAKDDTVFTGIE